MHTIESIIREVETIRVDLDEVAEDIDTRLEKKIRRKQEQLKRRAPHLPTFGIEQRRAGIQQLSNDFDAAMQETELAFFCRTIRSAIGRFVTLKSVAKFLQAHFADDEQSIVIRDEVICNAMCEAPTMNVDHSITTAQNEVYNQVYARLRAKYPIAPR